MKIKYLVRSAGEGSALVQVSGRKWYEITKESNRLPRDQQRYFIRDVIDEDGELDVLVLEVSREEFKAHQAKAKMAERHSDSENTESALALDAPLSELPKIPIIDTVPGSNSAEDEFFKAHLVEDLLESLDEWKPWAHELLRLYMNGQRRSSTKWLAKTCGVSEQMARRYKKAFRKHIEEFFTE